MNFQEKEIYNYKGIPVFDIDLADHGVHVLYFHFDGKLFTRDLWEYSPVTLEEALRRITKTITHEMRIKELEDTGISRYEAMLQDSKERTNWNGKEWVA